MNFLFHKTHQIVELLQCRCLWEYNITTAGRCLTFGTLISGSTSKLLSTQSRLFTHQAQLIFPDSSTFKPFPQTTGSRVIYSTDAASVWHVSHALVSTWKIHYPSRLICHVAASQSLLPDSLWLCILLPGFSDSTLCLFSLYCMLHCYSDGHPPN